MTRAVIIEDDILAAVALAQLLEGEGFEVRSFGTADEALESVLASPPDILIADWDVPGETSTAEVAQLLRKTAPNTKVVFLSGYDPAELRQLNVASEEVEYLSKPIQYDRFISDITKGHNL
ncbi:MAG: response regulator [Pseudomonadota bacterium]